MSLFHLRHQEFRSRFRAELGKTVGDLWVHYPTKRTPNLRGSLISSGKDEKLADLQGALYVASMSKDGRYVFFSVQDPKTGFDVYVIDLAGDGKLEPVLNSPFDEFDPRLSPDDKWLAYSSNENGTRELYVTPFPAGGSKWQVSSGGVAGHVSDRVAVDWSPDGKRLSYLQADKIYTVEVRTGGSKPEFSAPKERMSIPNGVEVISIIPEGNRSLATRPVGQRSASPMNLTVNWQHLLR